MNNCSNCAKLEAENVRLKTRIKELEKRIRIALKVIKRQKEQLDKVRRYVAFIINKYQPKLVEGNLPRGKWSLYKGRVEVAKAVWDIVAWKFTDLIYWKKL